MICHLCLCIADTSALDQSVDVCVLNYMSVGKCVISGAIWSATSFRTRAGSSSGPVALLGFSWWSCLAILFSPNTMLAIDGKGEGPLFGGGEFSLGKMD